MPTRAVRAMMDVERMLLMVICEGESKGVGSSILVVYSRKLIFRIDQEELAEHGRELRVEFVFGFFDLYLDRNRYIFVVLERKWEAEERVE